MAITKELVQKKADELKLTLTEDQVNFFVTNGVLPALEDSGTPPGDDEGDTDDSKKGAESRIRKLNADKKAAEQRTAEALSKLKEREDADAETKRKADEEAGNFKKIAEEESEKTRLANEKSEKIKANLKASLIKKQIEDAILSSGIQKDRLDKAVKLFSGEVKFTWINEDDGTFETSIEDAVVEDFKKENSFLYPDGTEGNDLYGKKYDVNRAPGTKTIGDKEKERLRAKFPVLQ